jgi:hypothetical protein
MARIETERVLPPPLPLLVVKAAAHLPLSARFYILPHEAETACAPNSESDGSPSVWPDIRQISYAVTPQMKSGREPR